MYKTYIKRVFDVLLACIVLVLVSPVLLLSMLLLKFILKGEVIFTQPRPGKDGKIFTIYKLRTMTSETDENGKLLPDMMRMTKFGKIMRKLSIDELPQLINIIKGQMSFIGPRPLLVQYLEHYNSEQMRRHEVLPGITGWAQVNGRNAISWENKFQLDVWYVDNISLLLDIKIVFMTIKNVLAKKDINNSQEDTMPLFCGSGSRIKESIGVVDE